MATPLTNDELRLGPPGRPARDDEDDGELSLLGLTNVVLRHRALILTLALVLGAVTAALAITSPRTYAATATFVPQAKTGGGNVSGLAAQFGLSVGAGDPSQSPQFYVDLTESREILGRVADTRFTYPTDSGTVSRTAIELWGNPAEPQPALRRESAIEELRRRVKARVTATTGVVELTVNTRDPVLARLVADRVLELVNQFNLQRRQSQAAAERRFTERRLAEVREELRGAENRFQSFLQGNRGFDAPALQFEQDRLRRAVALQQQIFVSLSQAYEQAKIDEVRDTPVITIVERPEVPVRPEPRGTIRKTILALLGGTLVGIALAFVLDFARRSGDDGSPEAAEFRALKRAAIDDLTHPWRPVLRLFGVGRRRASA